MDTITYTHKAVTRFQVSSWAETTLVDIDGTGTRHGEVYTPTRGLSRVEAVTVHVEVVPGMGTGELADLRGEGQLRIAGHSDDGYELVLEYSLG